MNSLRQLIISMTITNVGIIGSGFSGIISTYEFVSQASSSLNIFVFDASPFAGSGIAYSTDCPLHTLNVIVEKMSGLHCDPDHLYNWLIQSDQWRGLDSSFRSLKIHKGLFLPRMIYKLYLQHVADLTDILAQKKGISLQRLRESAVDIKIGFKERLEITTDSERNYPIDAVVLATGIAWTRPMPNSDGLDATLGYLEAPWPILTSMDKTKEWLRDSKEDTTIAIIGSGLTMLDALGSLHAVGYSGKVEVISHRGALPQPHDLTLAHPQEFHDASEFPMTALGVLRSLRSLSVSSQQRHGYDWRSIIDALRPIASSLWNRLPEREKRRILRHLFGRWNSYRHRSPPEALDLFHNYQKRNRLEVIKAKAISIGKTNQKIDVNIIDTRSGQQIKRSFDKVVNCSGPSYNINIFPNPFIKNLLRSGLVFSDPLGLGLFAKDNALITKNEKHKIFAIGSLLFGTLFETIAVPELRTQCHQIAFELLS